MFTGIVQATGKLNKLDNKTIIELDNNEFDIKLGDSVSVDGVCLTVKENFEKAFTVDISEETLAKTTLGVKSDADLIVNLEPALRISDRLGGHIVSGHVDGLGKVVDIKELDKSWIISIEWVKDSFAKYVVNKGSICVNGISLTIAGYKNNGMIFNIAIIPHTWKSTNLRFLNIGDYVNLEADALVKYVERLLKNDKNDFGSSPNPINNNWLRENGWLN
tara:strand:- start:15 stop:671 length:657 start_codon:yes stop_codon:yes gene_type:complete